MPRSAPRHKPGKKKNRPADKKIESPEPEQKDEVPPVYDISLVSWNDVLLEEENDEIVGEMMDALLRKIMDGCYKSDIRRQLIPYTVCWAKNYLVQTVESQFQHLDEGEAPEELCGTEDSEPLPAIPDCHAQGCVPIVYTGTYFTSQQVSIGQVPVQTEPSLIKQSDFLRKCVPKQEEMERKPRKDEPDSCDVTSICPPANPHRKKTPQVNKDPKFAPRKLLTSVVSSTEKKDVEVKDKNRESIAWKDGTEPSYSPKEPQPIPKLDPRCLPQHRTALQYEILDDNLSKPRPRKTGKLPRLEPKNKQQPESSFRKLHLKGTTRKVYKE